MSGVVDEDMTTDGRGAGSDPTPLPSRTRIASFRAAVPALSAAVADLGHRAARLLIPARLRRIYIPSAWCAIDRITVILFGFVCGIFQATGRFPVPQDAWSYWTANLASLYPANWGPDGTYIYPPVLAQITTLLHPIGWQVFIVVWTTLLWAALAYMLGRWTWLFVALGIVALIFRLPYEAGDVLGHALNGNVQLFIAAGLVVALRGDAGGNAAGIALGWLPGLLTKVVSGIGLVWYAIRLEWRPLVISLAAAAAVAAVSFVLVPSQWFQWVDWMIKNANVPPPVLVEPVPFIVRLPMSLALLVWGARTNRTWVVPIAVGWGTPALYLGTYPSMWIAAIPLYLWARNRPEKVPEPTADLEPRTGSV